MKWLLACLMPLGLGCATNLSSLQTAKTLNPGQIRITGGMGYFVPVGQLANGAVAGVKLGAEEITAKMANQDYVLTADDKESLGAAAIALTMIPPSSTYEINARVGVFHNFDLGFRYSINSMRGDAKLRLYHSGDGEDWDETRGRSYDVAIGAGVSKYILGTPISIIPGVKLDDFNRWDLEIPVYFSADWNSHIGVYFVPKLLLSRTTMTQTFAARPCSCGGMTPESKSDANVNMMFYGATLGLRFGGWRVTGLLEATVGNMEAAPVIAGKKRSIGGATIQPNIGLAVSF